MITDGFSRPELLAAPAVLPAAPPPNGRSNGGGGDPSLELPAELGEWTLGRMERDECNGSAENKHGIIQQLEDRSKRLNYEKKRHHRNYNEMNNCTNKKIRCRTTTRDK